MGQVGVDGRVGQAAAVMPFRRPNLRNPNDSKVTADVLIGRPVDGKFLYLLRLVKQPYAVMPHRTETEHAACDCHRAREVRAYPRMKKVEMLRLRGDAGSSLDFVVPTLLCLTHRFA